MIGPGEGASDAEIAAARPAGRPLAEAGVVLAAVWPQPKAGAVPEKRTATSRHQRIRVQATSGSLP